MLNLGGLSLPLALFCLAPPSAIRNPPVSSLQWSADSTERERGCMCVCVRGILSRHCFSLPCCMSPGRKCRAGVKFTAIGAVMMEPGSGWNNVCNFQSCSRRWRATSCQQEASWHLPSYFLTPPVPLGNIHLSASPYFPLLLPALPLSSHK